MIKYDFTNKNVIVTGANSGLGKATALAFASAGANVAIGDVKACTEVVEEIEKYGVKSFSYELDVRNYDDFEKFVDKTVTEFGSLDILANIAGIGTMMPLIVMPVELINAIIDIDLKGTVYGCKAALKYMIPQKSGKIVNTSSIAAKVCTENSSCYAAAKAGVMSLTAALAREVAQYDINVNAILPGIVRTNMWEAQLQMVAGDDEEKKKEVFAAFTKDIPLARPQEAIDIANTILFLCTEEACNITAQHVAIDGGYTC